MPGTEYYISQAKDFYNQTPDLLTTNFFYRIRKTFYNKLIQ